MSDNAKHVWITIVGMLGLCALIGAIYSYELKELEVQKAAIEAGYVVVGSSMNPTYVKVQPGK